MMKHIKQGENIGVAKQVQGAVVDVYPHPRFRGMYEFVYKCEKWTCSDYAFNESCRGKTNNERY
jgi:hypothetical protein